MRSTPFGVIGVCRFYIGSTHVIPPPDHQIRSTPISQPSIKPPSPPSSSHLHTKKQGIWQYKHALDQEILSLAFPALGALIADPLVSAVDTAFVGHLGTAQLAALGVNSALFALIFIMFNFLAYGATPMIANALGRGDTASAGKVVTQALVLALAVGTGALIVVQIWAPQLMQLMGVSDALMPYALPYLRIRTFAGPALLLITAAQGAFRGFEDFHTPLRVVLSLSAANIVLDALFIFGFQWGIAGAAWATVLAQWGGALWFCALLLGRHRQQYHILLALPTLHELRPFLNVGWAMIIRTGLLLFTLTFATSVATRLGDDVIASHQIAFQIWVLLVLLLDALAVPAQTLVGRFMGEGDVARARAVSNRSLVLGLALGAVIGLALAVLSPVIPRFFTQDAALLTQVWQVFPFLVFTQPLNALAFIWDGVFIGLEHFRTLALAMLIATIGTVILLAMVLKYQLGITGLWWAMSVFIFLRTLALGLRYRYVLRTSL